MKIALIFTSIALLCSPLSAVTPTSELTSCNGEICRRQFFCYDSSGAMIEAIYDNGKGSSPDDLTGVTVRRIERTQRVAEGPAVGLPKVEERLYWDPISKEERCLSSIHYDYDQEHRTITSVRFDGKGEYYSTSQKKWDEKGNLTSEIDALGNEHLFTYDGAGHCTGESVAGLGFGIRYTYDHQERPLGVSWFDRSGELATIDYEYDVDGSFSKVRRERGALVFLEIYDGKGRLISRTDRSDQTTRWEYDDLFHPIVVHYPDGSWERLTYDKEGRKVRADSSFGAISEWNYDAIGRLISEVTRPEDGRAPKQLHHTYRGDYLVATVGPTGLETLYERDGAGRVVQEQSGRIRKAFEYDSLGREVKQLQWFGGCPHEYQVSLRNYDALDRVVEEWIQEADQTVRRHYTYEYDLAGNRVATTSFGEGGRAERREIRNAETDLQEGRSRSAGTCSYDGFGRLLSEEGASYHYIFEYDLCDRPIVVSDNKGRTVVRDYDRHGFLNSEKQATGFIVRYYYDALGRKRRLRLPDGSQIDYLYNCIDLERVRRLNARGEELYFHQYVERDLSGRSLEEFRSLDGAVVRRHWDEAGQLIGIESSTYTAEGLCELAPEPEMRAYAGKVDERGRMIDDLVDNVVYYYEYDGFDRRISKRWMDEKGIHELYYLYDGDQIIAECDEKGQILKLRIIGELPDQPVAIEEGGAVELPDYDLCGRPVVLAPSGGESSALTKR